MVVKSAMFQASPRLSGDGRPLKIGERSLGVAFVQAALEQAGFKPGQSIDLMGKPDGIFGEKTKAAVMKFQGSRRLMVDGIVGPKTLGALDALLPRATPLASTTVSSGTHGSGLLLNFSFSGALINSSVGGAVPTAKFKIGTDDPPNPIDAGAGVWNSEAKDISTRAMYRILSQPATILAFTTKYGVDAGLNLAHFFANMGTDLIQRLDRMVREVPSAQKLFIYNADDTRRFIETLPQGTSSFTQVAQTWGSNGQDENGNWYRAIGGYRVWIKGTATVNGDRLSADFTYNMFDRYNWDGGKSVEINLPLYGNYIVTDERMAKFHRQGFAKEYNNVGSIRKNVSWQRGKMIDLGS